MKKIYIVDDDQDIVESLSLVLKGDGYVIASQNDEDNIVDNITNFDANLIILDVMFPENDGAGFEMARKIKKSDKLKNIPILMLSAVNEKGIFPGKFSNRDRDDAWLPVNEFVEKPINPTILKEKVAHLLAN